jgi:hypothetical protein
MSADPIMDEVVLTISPTLEPGTYPAVVAGWRGIDYTTPEGEDRPLIAWAFVVEADGGPVEVEGITSRAAAGARHKASQWMAALGLREPGDYRAADVIGRPCTVIVEADKDGNAKVTGCIAPMKGR